jgi:hypothetical protein
MSIDRLVAKGTPVQITHFQGLLCYESKQSIKAKQVVKEGWGTKNRPSFIYKKGNPKNFWG